MPDLDDDDLPKKASTATIVRRVLVAVVALACAGGWVYTRYLVKKHALGEACTFDLHCKTESPRCLKSSVDEDGVCSRPCDTDADCAEGIRCIKVELEDRDERGRPLEGGYCFPQSLLDARRKKAHPDAGAPKSVGWLDAPEIPGQLEGEVTIDRGGVRSTFEVKGSLLARVTGKARTVIDTSTLRVYTVDDEKKTFAASQLSAGPGEVRLVKTDRKDRIVDRDCEIWQIEEAGAKPREACVVKGASLVDPTARVVPALDRELAVRGVFPLRIVEGDRPKLLVTKLDARPIPASSFAIPKTYRNLAGR